MPEYNPAIPDLDADWPHPHPVTAAEQKIVDHLVKVATTRGLTRHEVALSIWTIAAAVMTEYHPERS